MNTPEQLPLAFEHRPSLGGDDYLITTCNSEAVAWLDKWPNWGSPALVIYGPPGCGKTHLAHVFMASTGAVPLTPALVENAGLPQLLSSVNKCVLDDADKNFNEESLFHLYNALTSVGGHMLLTAAYPPAQWNLQLADLASRLKAAPAVEIGLPDDILIRAVLAKLFSDRQLRVEEGVIEYLAIRMQRSLDTARHIVAAIDRQALAAKRNITLPLVRKVLEER